MTDIINLEDWLEAYATGTDGGDTPAGTPAADPYTPGGGSIDPAASRKGDPNISNMPPEEMDSHPDDNDPSSDPQNPDMPEELKEALNKNKKAKEFFEKNSPSVKKMIYRWILRGKREETRTKRIKLIIKEAKLGNKNVMTNSQKVNS